MASLVSGLARLHRRWIRWRLEPGDWKPASIEDARLLASDLFLTGSAFSTADGFRIAPESVEAVVDFPGYWAEETGKLRPAVMAFLLGAELNADEFSLVVAYVRRWVAAQVWIGGEAIEDLRRKLYLAETTRQLHQWAAAASELGIDPF